MALTETRPETAVAEDRAFTDDGQRTQPTAVEKVLGSGDHKTIGRIFIGASILFLAADFLLTAMVHLSSAAGAGELLEESVQMRFGLSSPLGLLLCGAMPLFLGLAIYLVPLQVGSPAIAFPRAAALSLWSWLLGTGLFTVALLAKGSYGGSSEKMVRLGNVSVGLLVLSLLVGIVCVMVTVISHRVAGMTIGRVPFFSFSMLVTGALWLTTLPPFLAVLTLWHIRQAPVSDYSDLAGVYPQFAWIFHQPAIYIVAIPILGILADVCGSISGARQANYGLLQGLITAFGLLSFGPWATTGAQRNTALWVVFAIAAALPVLGVFGGSLDTLRRRPGVTGGFVLVVSAVLLLLAAVATGALQAIVTGGSGSWFDIAVGGFDGQGSGTSIGQFYFVIGAAALAGLGATFHWGTRIWQDGLPAGAPLGIAPVALLGATALAAGELIIGIATPDADGAEVLHIVSGIGGIVLTVAFLGAFAAIGAAAAGRKAQYGESRAPEATGGTLEWLTASPPVAGNFTGDLPAVESAYPRLDAMEAEAN